MFDTDKLKTDDLSNQPGWGGQALQQWDYRLE